MDTSHFKGVLGLYEAINDSLGFPKIRQLYRLLTIRSMVCRLPLGPPQFRPAECYSELGQACPLLRVSKKFQRIEIQTCAQGGAKASKREAGAGCLGKHKMSSA